MVNISYHFNNVEKHQNRESFDKVIVSEIGLYSSLIHVIDIYVIDLNSFKNCIITK